MKDKISWVQLWNNQMDLEDVDPSVILAKLKKAE